MLLGFTVGNYISCFYLKTLLKLILILYKNLTIIVWTSVTVSAAFGHFQLQRYM